MHTRLKYWAGDHLGYLDALTVLLNKCRMKCRAATKAKTGVLGSSVAIDDSIAPMWKERGARVTLILASQLVEMKVIPYFFFFLKKTRS